MCTVPGSDVLLAYSFTIAEMAYCEDDEAYTPGPSLAPATFMVLGEAPGMYSYSHMFYIIYKVEYFSILPHVELSPRAHKIWVCLDEVDVHGDSGTDAATEKLCHVRPMIFRASPFSSVKWSHLLHPAL